MVKQSKHSWTDDDTVELICIRNQAVLMQQEGDSRGLFEIIYSEWKKLFPLSKASLGSLKIYISKLVRSGKSGKTEGSVETGAKSLCTTYDDTEANNGDEQSGNLIHVNKDISNLDLNTVEHEEVSSAISKEINQHASIDHACKPKRGKRKIPQLKGNITRNVQQKQHKDKVPQKMREYIVQCHKTLLNSHYKKRPAKDDINIEIRRRVLQKYPDKTISLRTIGRVLIENKKYVDISDQVNQSTSNHANIPDDSTRLKNMRNLAIALSSQPIVKYICYNQAVLRCQSSAGKTSR